MEIGQLHQQNVDRGNSCIKIKNAMHKKGWRYIPGNFEFLKDDKCASVHIGFITFSFASCDGRYKYNSTHHKIKLA